MAEVRKNKKPEKYDISDKLDAVEKKAKKDNKISKKDSVDNTKDTKKASLWVKFRIFCHGVASEFRKVHWPTKEHMLKYSIATIVFVLFLAIYFYLIDIIFALIRTLIG